MNIVKKLRARLNSRGQEVLSDVPKAIELGIKPEDPIEVRINKLFASQRAEAMFRNTGFETLEEANDFDVNGEEELLSPYEHVMMVDEFPIEEETPPPAPSEPSEVVEGTDPA